MKNILTQARSGFKDLISINKQKITLERKPYATDPITGDPVIDPTATPVEYKIYARLTHERIAVPTNQARPSGLSTNLQRFIICDYQTTIQEHDLFNFGSKRFEIGPVDTVEVCGEIIGYQAPLTEAK